MGRCHFHCLESEGCSGYIFFLNELQSEFKHRFYIPPNKKCEDEHCAFFIEPTVAKIEEFDLWIFLSITFLIGAMISKNDDWRIFLIVGAFIMLTSTFGSAITKKRKYLFNIDLNIDPELEDDLNKSIITDISEKLKGIFETKGFPLSGNARVTKDKENEWVITDKEVFIVKKNDGNLKIYKRKKELRDIMAKCAPLYLRDNILFIFAVIVALMAIFISFMTQYFQPAT